MADFVVLVKRVSIVPHHDADNLEIALIDGYQSIVQKSQFSSGDLVAYIPEQSIVPLPLLREMGLEGKLAGPLHNRVKAIKLRGVLSQGLCYPAHSDWVEGQDVSDKLGITKWEPAVPSNLRGEIYNAGFDRTLKYDIENIKNYPNILEPGEDVVFTEKIHGSWCLVALVPENWAHPIHGRLIVSSKGLSARGLALKPNERNSNNLYLRVVRYLDIERRLEEVYKPTLSPSGWLTGDVEPEPVFLLGEVFGQGLQDLSYGANINKDTNIGFRVFDIFVGKPGKGRYLNDNELDFACEFLSLQRVPVLYRGPFWHSKLMDYTNGFETVSGKNMHVREGVVIRPVIERENKEIGRVQLKSVSEAYLLRKNKNATEYQ